MGSIQTLRIRLLGEYQISHGDRALSDSLTPRLHSLVAYLLLHRDTAISRQQLAFHFWPDSTDAQARANLRKLVYRLRQAFPEIDEYLHLDGATLSWRAEASLQVDASDFTSQLQEAEEATGPQKVIRLEEALKMYRGDLLPDLYEEWVLPLRERLRQRYLNALDLLVQLLEEKREYAAAGKAARRLLREDPLRESAYRRLMRLQALSGDVAGALRTYHTCATQLERELGLEPGPATQEAYRRLLDRQEMPEPTPASLSPRRLPLVGRDTAWRALLAAWRAVAGGKPQVALISGVAGIGKTRLAEELLAWTRRQGIPSLSTACFATAERLPMGAVADWLRAEPAQWALPSLAPRWRSEVARVLPELLAVDPDLQMPRPMTEAWQQQHLFMALAEAVTAAGDPLLLFLDDLHWADANTLSWLHFLVRQKGDRRFLLLATVRREEVLPDHPLLAWEEALARTLPVHRISLERLDVAATAALASHLLGGALDEEAADALYEETEGNPLFTVEMARAGLQQPETTLPQKVRSVIEIRLNRLGPQARELAGLAAVIGRSFTFPLLAAASPLPTEEVVRALDELWQRQIVREQGEAAYDFSHDKIREVALAQLSPAQRRWWHYCVAEALSQVFAGDLDALHGRIAAHWEAAGYPERAAGHYLQAARAASGLYAHEETVQQLQQALALLPAGQPQRSEVQAQLGKAFVALGRYQEAAAAFQQAVSEAQEPLDRAHLLGRRVLALSGGGQYEEAEATYREAMALLEATPAVERDTASWQAWLDLHLSLLDVLYFANRSDEMQQICQAIADPLEAQGTARQRAHYFAFRARTQFRISRYRVTDEEVAQRQAALQWARQTGDRNLIYDHQFGLGFTLLWAGQVAQAIEELQQAAAQAKVLGNVPLQSRCLTYLGIAYRMQGQEAHVRETLAQGAAVVEAEGKGDYLGVAEAQRAWLAWRVGQKEAVERHGQAALAHWGPPDQGAYPMQWLARFPLLAMALEATQAAGSTPAAVADALTQARAMLAPVQQRLPDPVTEALEAAVAADTPSAVIIKLQEACRLARKQGHL